MRTPTPFRRAAPAALAAALLAGCATLGRQVFEQPVVTFRDVSVRGVGLQGGSLDVILSVYNPNRFRLDATRLTYRVLVDSSELGTGALDQRFVVQSGDSATVRLPVQFTFAGLGAAGRQLLRSGAVNYRVLGDVTVSTPLGSFTRPFDRTGQYTSLGGAR
jgi:LEA14-like dessication related protein